MCGGDAGLQEALDAGNVTKAPNAAGQMRYWIGKDVSDDLTSLSGKQQLSGSMKLNLEQWRFSMFITTIHILPIPICYGQI